MAEGAEKRRIEIGVTTTTVVATDFASAAPHMPSQI